MMINRRRVCGSLPYDYEVEYLESTGKQHIDLGFCATENIEIEAEVYRDNNNVRVDFGAEETWTQNVVRFITIDGGNADYQYGKSNAGLAVTQGTNLVGKLLININKRLCSIKNINTDFTYTKTSPSTNPFTTPVTFWLFCVNMLNEGTGNIKTAGSRIYYFKVTDTNVNMELIPVVKNNIGCLYDKVSKRLFYSQGEENLIVGPRKNNIVNEIEYLRSTGQQYIDTGIVPSEDLTVFIKFDFQEIVSNTSVFGSRGSASSNDRYWLNYDNKFEIGYGNYNSTNIVSSTGTINTIAFNEIINGDHTFTINGNRFIVSGTPNTSTNIIAYGRVVQGQSPILSKMKLYSMSMMRNNNLIRNFIPVERNGVGYLYDKVSKQLFGNAGTGSFIIGPRVS